MRRSTEILRGILAVVLLAGFLAGIPVLLVWLVGQPLPTALPGSWQAVTDAVSGRYGFDWTLVAKPLAVLTWLAWAQFLFAVIDEFTAAVRGRPVRVRRGFGISRSFASTLVTAILSLGPSAGMAGAATAYVAAVPLHQHPLVTQVDARPAAAGTPLVTIGDPVAGAATAPSAPTRTVDHVVVKGDTLWDLAERYYGDGTQCVRIFHENQGVRQPDGGRLRNINRILPGWVLTIPDTTAPATDPAAEPAPPVAAPGPPPTPATPPITGPAAPAPGGPDAGPAASPGDAVVGDAPHEPSTPGPSPDETAAAPLSPPTTTPTTEPPVSPAPATVPASATTSTTSTGSSPGAEDVTMLPARAPIIEGITGAVVLASGLLIALRRARQRRKAISALVPTHSHGRSRQIERAIIAAADVPLVRWAGQELAELFRRVPARRLQGAPVALELSEEAGIELLWDEPNPTAPAPWEATDGGWAWRLLYDPDAPVPSADAPSALPGLVTIGQRDGRQLLVDLEAYGSLAVTGDPAAVEAFARAAVLELGAADDIADAYIVTVGLDVDGVEQFERVTSATTTDALDRITSTAASVGEALAHAGINSTFTYRLGGKTALETVIVAANDDNPDTARALTDAATPHRGVAAIILTDTPDAGAHLELRADGTGRLEPLGIDLHAVGVTREVAAEIAVLLDDAAARRLAPGGSDFDEQVALLNAEVDADDRLPQSDWGRQTTDTAPAPETPTAAPATESPPPPGADDEDVDRVAPRTSLSGETRDEELAEITAEFGMDTDGYDDGDWVPPAPALTIRVLGSPVVLGHETMRRREAALAVLLACVGHPVTIDAVQDAIWAGAAVADKTVWNLISRTRVALGNLPDGRPAFPPMSRPDYTMTLNVDVWTDYALLKAHYEQALTEPSSRAIPILRDGLALIDGPPFAADGYDWAHLAQYVADAEALIERTSEHLIDLALTAGDTDLARHAALQGLRGLPGNEVLYRSRLRIENQAGNQTAVHTAYHELITYLTDLDTEPSDQTSTLYRQLTRQGR
jgi:DNA-binding SARP family transcriptional activator